MLAPDHGRSSRSLWSWPAPVLSPAPLWRWACQALGQFGARARLLCVGLLMRSTAWLLRLSAIWHSTARCSDASVGVCPDRRSAQAVQDSAAQSFQHSSCTRRSTTLSRSGALEVSLLLSVSCCARCGNTSVLGVSGLPSYHAARRSLTSCRPGANPFWRLAAIDVQYSPRSAHLALIPGALQRSHSGIPWRSPAISRSLLCLRSAVR